jgi:hypothetical protein
MKKLLLYCSFATALVSAATLIAKPGKGPHKHGTDILHLSLQATFANEGVESNATGRVSLMHNEQGNANHQELDITLKGLEADSTYDLLGLLNDDTNLTEIASFDTDANGAAALRYRDFGNGKGMGHGRTALPAVINPLEILRGVAVFNWSTQAVLSVDLTSPAKLQYLIKRDLSTDSIDALLRIKATTSTTQFRLDAKGLAASTDYLLVVNGDIAQTNSTDANGNLQIKSLDNPPANILDVQSLALWDTSSNVVLNTTLP